MELCFGTTSEAIHGLEAFYSLATQPTVHTERRTQNVVETIQNTDSLVILPLPPGLVREKCPQVFCGNLDEQVDYLQISVFGCSVLCPHTCKSIAYRITGLEISSFDSC